MNKLEVLHFPDKRLRKIAVPVKNVDDSIVNTIDQMFFTMYEEKGIGLAATQVNIHKRIIVIDVSENKDTKICLINPKILFLSEELETMDEGCLSIPGFYEPVSRPKYIKVSSLNYENQVFEFEADGLLSTCIQHEIDHLEGILFIDYLSKLKKSMIIKKLSKQKKPIERIVV